MFISQGKKIVQYQYSVYIANHYLFFNLCYEHSFDLV